MNLFLGKSSPSELKNKIKIKISSLSELEKYLKIIFEIEIREIKGN